MRGESAWGGVGGPRLPIADGPLLNPDALRDVPLCHGAVRDRLSELDRSITYVSKLQPVSGGSSAGSGLEQ